MENVKKLGYDFFLFLKKNLMPILKKEKVIVLCDNQFIAGSEFNVNYFNEMREFDHVKIHELQYFERYEHYDDDHVYVVCSLFPDNETFFEFKTNDPSDKFNYEMIVHANIDNIDKIQSELYRSCGLCFYDFPWDDDSEVRICFKIVDKENLIYKKSKALYNNKTKSKMFFD